VAPGVSRACRRTSFGTTMRPAASMVVIMVLLVP
jgi:hypothetical protein